MFKSTFFKALFIILPAIILNPVFAQTDTTNPWLVRFGATYVQPLDDSDGVIGDTGLGLIPGKDEVDVEGELGFTFSLSYAFSSHWAATLLAAAPYKHDINGAGVLEGIDIGETYHLPPSLTLEYRFNPNGKIRPYIGAGVNWTWFFKSKSNAALTNALDGIVGGVTNTDLDLDNSFGFAANVGIDWSINDRWGVNTSVWFLDINSEAEVYVNGNLATTVGVAVDPVLYTLGLTYRF